MIHRSNDEDPAPPQAGSAGPASADQTSLGQRARPGSGPVHGSGADAGGTTTGDEDYDSDAVGGGGAPPTGVEASQFESHGSGEDIIPPPRSGAF
ncbi:hypothetical protein WG907_11265 [Sphingobium sp. AN558]|uniref:hypothetical protein n=1 Tax=Sphingobium sp. AN558 TaxID=3133442 RepID=UPI0030BD4CC8